MKYPVKFGGLPVTLLCIGVFIFGGVLSINSARRAIKTGMFGKITKNDKPRTFRLLILVAGFCAMFWLGLAVLITYITVNRAATG
jgi:hypothetical protein